MSSYTNPKEYYKGQLLWLDLGRPHFFVIVKVMDLKPSKAEVLIGPTLNGTPVWVEKHQLFERRDS